MQAQRLFLGKNLWMKIDWRKALFSAICAFSIAFVAITFCIMVGLCPVDGWTLASMVVVSLISIGGILRYRTEGQDGSNREG